MQRGGGAATVVEVECSAGGGGYSAGGGTQRRRRLRRRRLRRRSVSQRRLRRGGAGYGARPGGAVGGPASGVGALPGAGAGRPGVGLGGVGGPASGAGVRPGAAGAAGVPGGYGTHYAGYGSYAGLEGAYYSEAGYPNYSGAWYGAIIPPWAGMGTGTSMYANPGYGATATNLGMNNTQPASYDYGGNVVVQPDSVYVNGDAVGTPQQYAAQATQIAGTGTAEPDQASKWLPLGVFAVVEGDSTDSNDIFQLAVNPDGIFAALPQSQSQQGREDLRRRRQDERPRCPGRSVPIKPRCTKRASLTSPRTRRRSSSTPAAPSRTSSLWSGSSRRSNKMRRHRRCPHARRPTVTKKPPPAVGPRSATLHPARRGPSDRARFQSWQTHSMCRPLRFLACAAICSRHTPCATRTPTAIALSQKSRELLMRTSNMIVILASSFLVALPSRGVGRGGPRCWLPGVPIPTALPGRSWAVSSRKPTSMASR